MSDYLASSAEPRGGRPRSFSSLQSAAVTAGDSLAESITRKASTQTYYTIRLLTDRPLVGGAYRAYAYFRWVDDILDLKLQSKEERHAFLRRQQMIVDRSYRGEWPGNLRPEEELVADLIACDTNAESGLHACINQMMAVMAFDAGRKGRLISQLELDIYTLRLSMAVTEALHYFIGHDCASPPERKSRRAVLKMGAAVISQGLRSPEEERQVREMVPAAVRRIA